MWCAGEVNLRLWDGAIEHLAICELGADDSAVVYFAAIEVAVRDDTVMKLNVLDGAFNEVDFVESGVADVRIVDGQDWGRHDDWAG